MNPKLHHDLVRGTPIAVDGRVLVPEARVTTVTLREATFGTRRTRVAGMRFSRARPTALVEKTPHGERYHRIEDVTGRALLALGIAAIAAPIMLNLWLGAWPGACRKRSLAPCGRQACGRRAQGPMLRAFRVATTGC
ncbi:MAG TPA: hypothetical protein VJ793_26950 [Anaerolineae bacterium]|nr:hypothetical protein [Anaerolineae bacterium]